MFIISHELSLVRKGSTAVSAAPVGVAPNETIRCTATRVRRDAERNRRDTRAPLHSRFMRREDV